MADGVHANINTEKAEAGVHDGELEGLGDARDGEEVRLVSDQEPHARRGLAGDHAIAEQRAAEIGAYSHFSIMVMPA